MRISLTEFHQFEREFGQKHYIGGEWMYLRYGQAWYNYFKLHAHDAKGEERILLDRIYNEPKQDKAKALIVANFTDSEN